METAEFVLVRQALRDYAERHRCASAQPEPTERTAAQKALETLGLDGLRAGDTPEATAQECALLAEEWGRHPLTASFLGTVLLAPELTRLLEAGLPGTPTIALARDLRFPEAQTLDAPGDQLVAWDCAGATHALLVLPDGTVHAVAPGRPTRTADPLRSVCATTPGTRVLGRLSPAQTEHWRAWALTMVASELTGAAASFLAQAVEYARDRVQYGRPIGSFQAVQHLLADALVDVEACASAARYAAWCLDHATPSSALRAAGAAKAEAAESCVRAVQTGMQVFGGIAQTWEHIAHLYLRRVLVGERLLADRAELLTALAHTGERP